MAEVKLAAGSPFNPGESLVAQWLNYLVFSLCTCRQIIELILFADLKV